MVFESGFPLARTRTLFLRLTAACYAMAFLSLYPQIPGLYGENGLLPAKAELDQKAIALKKWHDVLLEKPTLLWFAPYIGLSTEYVMDLICIIGTLLSSLIAIAPSYGSKTMFVVLWALYMSVYQVGQTFLWFQWDILLLEVGFLAAIAAPFHSGAYYEPRAYDHISMFLVRWLLFRMMFASGVVKLTSRCPTWWGLTALPLHYESQCIPTPLAWFAFQMPDYLQKLSVVATYLIEIPFTFLFFAPTRSLRKFTFFVQVFLMLNIMATGNYNFFNLLYIALCVSVMDDSWFMKRDNSVNGSFVLARLSRTFNMGVTIGLAYFTARLFFDIEIGSSIRVEPKLQFTEPQFFQFVAASTPIGIMIGAAALAVASLLAIYKSLFETFGALNKLSSLCTTIMYITVGVLMFGVSIPTFTRGLDVSTPKWIPDTFSTLNRNVHSFHLVNSYGLFRRMTGVGGRPEVIVEGADAMEGPWKEYHFMYKPGNLSAAPVFCLPHQPRLDWQMWFAALGNFQHNPWFISFAYRLLQNEPSVLQLIDQSRNPFPKSPPKYIRAQLYHYHFTSSESADWWSRDLQGEFMPILSADHQPLLDYLTQIGAIGQDPEPVTNLLFKQILDWMREQSRRIPPHVLVWSLSWIALPISMPVFTSLL